MGKYTNDMRMFRKGITCVSTFRILPTPFESLYRKHFFLGIRTANSVGKNLLQAGHLGGF